MDIKRWNAKQKTQREEHAVCGDWRVGEDGGFFMKETEGAK